MTKSLQELMDQDAQQEAKAASKPPRRAPKKKGTAASQPAATKAEPVTGSGTYKAPSRQQKVGIIGYHDPAVRKQLKRLAIDQERSLENLQAEAFNLLFEKYGMSRIA